MLRRDLIYSQAGQPIAQHPQKVLHGNDRLPEDTRRVEDTTLRRKPYRNSNPSPSTNRDSATNFSAFRYIYCSMTIYKLSNYLIH